MGKAKTDLHPGDSLKLLMQTIKINQFDFSFEIEPNVSKTNKMKYMQILSNVSLNN